MSTCPECGWLNGAHRVDCEVPLQDRTPTDPGATAVLHVDTDEEPQDNTEALS